MKTNGPSGINKSGWNLAFGHKSGRQLKDGVTAVFSLLLISNSGELLASPGKACWPCCWSCCCSWGTTQRIAGSPSTCRFAARGNFKKAHMKPKEPTCFGDRIEFLQWGSDRGRTWKESWDKNGCSNFRDLVNHCLSLVRHFYPRMKTLCSQPLQNFLARARWYLFALFGGAL